MINSTCDGCHRTLRIGNEFAGQLGHCPYCRTNSRVPGYPKRTSKLVIIARISIYPLLCWVLDNALVARRTRSLGSVFARADSGLSLA